MSFRATLQRLRDGAGLSKRALESQSGIDHAVIQRIESGKRGVPTYKTVFELASALGESSKVRVELLESALSEQTNETLDKFGIYYFLALASEKTLEDVSTYIYSHLDDESFMELRHNGVLAEGLPVRDLLLSVAEDADLSELRRVISQMIFSGFSFDYATGAISLELTSFGKDLLHGRAS